MGKPLPYYQINMGSDDPSLCILSKPMPLLFIALTISKHTEEFGQYELLKVLS